MSENSTDSLVAYHGPVELIHWEDTSGGGARIKLGLADRDELKYFDSIIKRRKGYAGQRFSFFWQTIDGDALQLMPSEGWFAGAQWSTNVGASIVFSLHPADLDLIRGLTARDQQDEKFGHKCFLSLVELDDDETPIDQQQREKVEAVAAPPRKGGRWSKNAGILCNDMDFQNYVLQKFAPGDRPNTEDETLATFCAAWLRGRCSIASRRDLDHDDGALHRYQTLVKKPYLDWLSGQA